MKRILLSFIAFLLFSHNESYAQAPFTLNHKTVTQTIPSGPFNVYDRLSVNSPSNLTIKWHVISSDFTADWLTNAAFGICNDYLCRGNGTGLLWNEGTSSGTAFTSTYPTCVSCATHDTTGEDFHLQLLFGVGVSGGTHTVQVQFVDQASGWTDTATFILTKNATGVTNVNNPQDNINLYPNPATNELNVVYDDNADVKNIAVYNIIGKIMNVYKVTGNSANLNIDNIPSGIYFVRLYNSGGNIVSTRKFTKQ